EEMLDKASEIGVKWTRLGATWPAIEKKPGEYNWQETDAAFAAALSKGITPFVTLGGANKLYSSPIKGKDQRLIAIYGQNPAPPTSSESALKAWLKFVREAVSRYKDQIKYWEVWNEPNHHHYWGDNPDGKEYGKLLRETALVIKEIDPEARIIGGAMAGLDPDFTDDFLSAGTSDLIDIITYHNYGAIPEERIYLAVKVREVINRYNPRIELWQGECGYPSHSSTRDYRGISPWGLLIQAKWLLRQSFTDTYFCGATLSNYFKLTHRGGRGKMPERTELSAIDSILGFPERGGSRVKSIGVNEKCLLDNPDLNPKPAYFAYQNLCALMDDRYRPEKRKTEIEITDPGIFYGIGKEDDAFPSVPLRAIYVNDDKQLLVAYWLPWHPQEIINPAYVDLRVEGTFSDPVRVDLLNGEVYAVNQFHSEGNWSVFTGIPMADYPLIIMERSAVEISDSQSK
ncbi:MAG: hypothetical protein E4H13_03825, partial [Calditrichales bacterium]